MTTLTVSKLRSLQGERQRHLKLMLAQKGHISASKFEIGRYDVEQYWIIYVDGEPSFFSHSHKLDVGDGSYFRIGSKTTLIGKHLPFKGLGKIPTIARPTLGYVATYHQIKWANDIDSSIPKIVSLFDSKEYDSIDSNRIYNLIQKNRFYGFKLDNSIECTVNKKKQTLVFVDEPKINEVYDCIQSQFEIILDF